MRLSKLWLYLIYSGYFLTLLGLCFYSYALVDPNLTFFNNEVWLQFRESLIHLGYYQRQASWNIYLSIIGLLFIFHFLCIRFYEQIQLKFILPIVGILFLSYPFLSHDLFNYMFDARIFTYYHQNPYLRTALSFPEDDWLRFMQWVHRSYPYGPTFLPLTFIPSFMSFGKFVSNFFLFKGMFLLLYYGAVISLYKMNKKWSIFFATHPLILIEGIVNTHNDLIGLAWGVIGIYFLFNNRPFFSRFLFCLSIGIKYISLPVILLTKDNKRLNILAFAGQVIILMYLSFLVGVQPWYFLALFIFIPSMENVIRNSSIFFLGLLLSYYPYIRLGGWDTKEKVALQHTIILVFLSINSVFFIYLRLKNKYFP